MSTPGGREVGNKEEEHLPRHGRADVDADVPPAGAAARPGAVSSNNLHSPAGDDSRGRILRAAAELFRRQRFDRTTMQDIARGVGLTKGSLYHHISSKQALLYEIIQHTVDRALPRLEQIANMPVPASERLRQAVRLHILILAHDRDNVECSIEEGRSLIPEYRDAVVAGRNRYEQLVRGIIGDGIRAGEFAPTDARLAGFALLGMLNWVARWYRPDGERSAAEIAAQFADYAVAMMRAGTHDGEAGPTPDAAESAPF